MKKIVVTLLTVFCSLISFSQEFKYSFKIVDATTNETGKHTINLLRDVMGVQVIRFYDNTDLFVVETHLDFNVEELVYKLALNDILVNGSILKENLG